MWNRIIEIGAASLLVFSLWAGHVRAEDACTTPADIIAQIGDTPAYDLTGVALDAFIKTLDEIPGPTAPEGVTELLVFSHGDAQHDAFALVVLFTHGCAYSHVIIPLSAFLEVWKGKSA